MEGHSRVGTKFVCLIPNHPRRGTIGTIGQVFEHDVPPRPPMIVVGVTWDGKPGSAAIGQKLAPSNGPLEQLTLDASNHIVTPSCNRHEEGDAIAVKGATRDGFCDVTVIKQVLGSRYLVAEIGSQKGNPQRQFEVEFNAGNSYRPRLSQEVCERFRLRRCKQRAHWPHDVCGVCLLGSLLVGEVEVASLHSTPPCTVDTLCLD